MKSLKANRSLMAQLLTAGLVTLTALCAVAQEGGKDGGGGTSVTFHQQQGLLDLYVYNQDAFMDREAGDILPATKASKALGFDRLLDKTSRAFQLVNQQIQVWAPSSPIIAKSLVQAVQNLPIYYVTSKIKIQDQQYVISPEKLKGVMNLHTMAYYVKDFGVFVSQKDFESLSLKNQAALIIHEAWRHSQLSFGSNMSNDSIEKLTAAIMQAPVSGQTLDSDELLTGALRSQLEDKKTTAKMITEFEGLQKAICSESAPASDAKSNFCAIDLNSDINDQKKLSADIDSMHGIDDVFNASMNNKTLSESFKLYIKLETLEMNLITESLGMSVAEMEGAVFDLNKAGNLLVMVDVILNDINEHGFGMSKYNVLAFNIRNTLVFSGLITAQ